MPRLPTVEDLGGRPIPSGQGGAVSLDLQTPRLSPEYQAAAELGDSLNNLGTSIHKLIERDRIRNDDARVEDATTQYYDALLDLRFNEDTGYEKVLGGDAVKRGVSLVDEMKKSRTEAATRIRNTLTSPEQIAAFDKRVAIADRQAHTNVYQHVAEQARVYRTETYKGVLEAEIQYATLNYEQPGAVDLSVLRVDNVVLKQAVEAGLDPSREGDLARIDMMRRTAETEIHKAVISQMLQKGEDLSATAYFHNVKERLTKDAFLTLGADINAASIDNEASRGVEEAWTVLGPHSPNDPVRVDELAEYVRVKYQDNPTIAAAAEKRIRARASDHNFAQAELNASYSSKILEAYQEGAPLEQLQAMPEWRQLEAGDRQRLEDYIVDRGYTLGQRKAAEDKLERDGIAARIYLEFSDPNVLKGKSRDQIKALLPLIGEKRAKQLLDKHESINSSEASFKRAVLNEGVKKRIASDVGLPAYAKNPTDEERERLGRFYEGMEEAVTVAIAEAEAAGKKLGMKEVEDVMHNYAKQRVMTTVGMPDPEFPARALTVKEQARAFVPMDRILTENPRWLISAINHMKSWGAIPLGMDDATALDKYRNRLERAYGHSLSGGSFEQGKRILMGTDE